jgi:hypothetical protein
MKRAGCLVLSLLMLASSYPGLAENVPVPAGMRKEILQDPVLNMEAFDVFVPAKWHFVGRLLQGSSCDPTPFAVFRMTSPDGLTVLEKLPGMDWKWGNAPNSGGADCLPIKKEMTATEFSKVLAQMLKVDYVASDPFPAEVQANQKKASDDAQAQMAGNYQKNGMTPPTVHVSMDRAVVRFRNGSFIMKGLITVTMRCAEQQFRSAGGPLVTHSCKATARYLHAPEAQFDAMRKLTDNAGGIQDTAWTKAWIAEDKERTAKNIQTIRSNAAAQAARNRAQSSASNEQFQQSQATRQRMHEEFLNTMQRGTNMSMNRTGQAMQARSTATSNVVDYALDRQTVRDPNSGQVNKVSSQYSYTWVDSTGKTSYQTNDPNANPNGSLQGNWSRQQVVNGDGTP